MSKTEDDYAVYDENSCRGHSKRTGLGFHSKSINKTKKYSLTSNTLSKTRLLGKDPLKIHMHDPITGSIIKFQDTEDSKTSSLGRKKDFNPNIFIKKHGKNLKNSLKI